ncbi:MAG: hypothetical protein HQ538_05810, partial [Parcubacteria group bacterium]|nr:hypothetical protein [Parcubacteria group bacterium]
MIKNFILKTKKYFHKKINIIVFLKTKKYFILSSFLFSVFTFFVFANRAEAGPLESVICQILAVVLKIQFFVSASLLALGGDLLDKVIGSALDIQNLDSVELGWSLARDTVNMFFVLILLIIAFATILRIEAYQYKALLPKLIMAILLVNFSRTICSVIIEFSNVLTKAFLSFGGGASSAVAISAVMGVGNIYELDDGFAVGAVDNTTMLVSYMFMTATVTGIAWAFVGITGMLLMRTVILMVLIVLAPFAFVFNVLPLTKSYFTRWWDTFLTFIFYSPIAAFCLYLTAVVMSEARGINSLGLGPAMLSTASSTGTTNILPTALSNPEFMWEFGLGLGLLGTSIVMIKEGGGMLANLALNTAQKGFFGAEALAGKFARRKLAGKNLASTAQNLKKKGYGAPILGSLLSGVNKAAKLTYLPTAWQAQREKEETETGAIGTGYARNQINKYLGKIPGASKDVTDYEQRAYKALVAEESKNFDTENSGDGWQYLVNTINDSAGKAGEEQKVEAGIRKLFMTKNINELIKAAAMDKNLASRLYSKDAIDEGLVGKYNA